MLAVDIHQHLWPEGVLRALSARSEPPCARWGDGVWTIVLAGEPAFTVDPAAHDPGARAGRVHAAGLDRALVALSSPVGIDALPSAAAAPLLAAWHDEALSLPPTLQAWAHVALNGSDGDSVSALDAALDGGAIGLCLPAGALAGPEAVERIGGLLARLEERLAPLFVHPGPPTSAPWGAAPRWWAPATSYVADLHAAWHAFAAWGRPAHPELHVVFAALAGLAPLHAERTAARGGPSPDLADPLVFYDVSSYGARALRAMAATVGIAQLVHGTDEPVQAAPATRPLGHDAHEAMRTRNVAHLLGQVWLGA